jgi:5-methylcytosine-specific restriction endonuclease McrA
MDLKSCSKCGRIHPRGFKCNAGRTYKKTNESTLRSRWAWTQKAKQIKDDAQGLCEVCRKQGVYTYDNLEVHHITKLADDPDGLLEDDNLICLCVYHHKQADAGDLDAEELRKIARERGKYDNTVS